MVEAEFLGNIERIGSHISYWAGDSKMQISRVAVVGLGTMGKGVCQLLATNGFRVSVVDLSEDVVDVGISAIASNLERLTEKGKITYAKSRETMSNISKKRIEDLVNEDLVIECVNENLFIKRQLFTNLDTIASRNAIFATNTSSFTIREVFGDLLGHRIAVGMHFFNPVWALPLVEFVVPLNLSSAHKDAIKEFLARNNRQVVEVADSPGFVVNRVLFRMIAESCALLEGGIASKDGIDLALKRGANLPMGPFELADFVGLDTSSEILRSLADRLSDDTYRRAAGFLDSMVEKGHLGRKSGRGFYEYKQKR